MTSRKIKADLTDMVMIGFKAPRVIVDAVDIMARKEIRSRSDMMRNVLVEGLRSKGYKVNDEVAA